MAYYGSVNPEEFNFRDYPSSCIKSYDHNEIVHRGVPQCRPIPNILKKTSSGIYDHSEIVPRRETYHRGTIPNSLEEAPQEGTIPKGQKKGFDGLCEIISVPQEGKIPKSLKELLARTAEEYQWSPEKLAYIERGLRNQNWSADQIALLEKTIREEKWTTKHIVELEKSFREKKNGDFFILAKGHIPNNNKRISENNCGFSATSCNYSGFTGRRSGGIHGLRDDISFVSVTINICRLM